MELARPNVQAEVTDLDWIVTSLERTPERLARFRQDSATLGLPIERIESTDGREVDLNELAQIGLVVSGRMGGWEPDQIGNALTHWMCWHQVVESGRITCIFEDAALVRRDFVERTLKLVAGLEAGWDIVQLGYNTNSVIEVAMTPDCYFLAGFSNRYQTDAERAAFPEATGPVLPLRLRNAFGSFAYLVSPAGAQKLIDGCFPLAGRSFPAAALGNKMLRATTIDGMMNTVYDSIQAYASFPPLAIRVSGETSYSLQVETPAGT